MWTVCVCSVFQVKKIFENEKRLQAGEHSLDLLAHDFQKNYNMYIFPVHWQFGQLDQHPVDGYVEEGKRRWPERSSYVGYDRLLWLPQRSLKDRRNGVILGCQSQHMEGLVN